MKIPYNELYEAYLIASQERYKYKEVLDKIKEELNYEVHKIEEPQEHKIPEKIYHCCMETNDEKIKFLIQNINDMSDKINEILDYLEEIE